MNFKQYDTKLNILFKNTKVFAIFCMGCYWNRYWNELNIDRPILLIIVCFIPYRTIESEILRICLNYLEFMLHLHLRNDAKCRGCFAV